MSNPASAIALVWAGVSLGGNMVAATAKFQADMVSRADLLRVGQAQFGWLGYTEAIALAAMVIAMVWCPCSRTR